MANTINSNVDRKATGKKKRGRPPKNAESRVEGLTRPRKRVPIHRQRDILTVLNKDKKFVYRFVSDRKVDGSRILMFKNAGYEFVKYDEDLGIGSDGIYHTENVGSIVRLPDGGEQYLYLMRVPKEWYDEDQAAKMAEIDHVENKLKRKRDADEDDGMYGEAKFSTKNLL
jgi:hypothetical protein